MELVYLWIKKYKNIHEQGFNFSPRFNCKYDEEKSELTIDENKNYIENFFGDNINVTAIVGKNGSGKSSVLECLAEIFRIEHNKNRNMIADYDHTFSFCLGFMIGTKQYEIKSINGRDSNTFIENEKIENLLEYFKYSHNHSSEDKQIDLDNTSIAKMIVHDYSKNKNFKLLSFMYLPNQIEIRLCDFEKKFEKLISNDQLYPMYRSEPDSLYIENRGNNINSQIEFFAAIKDKYHQFLILKLLEKTQETVDFYLSKEDIIQELSDSELLNEEDFNSYFVFKDIFINKKREIDKLTQKEKEIYINKYSNLFEFDFIDDKTRRYSDLSHGEKTFFGQLLNVYHNSHKSISGNLLFFFDEPEISLHPQWQKSYVGELYNLLEKLGKNNHFIFASHSPFLLSDIPKQNIIFLDTYKEDVGDQKVGNCKVLKHDEVLQKKQTFGQNIHTLLSDSFFMDNGLMGEFAKEKINEVIKQLSRKGRISKKKQEFCKNIIEIIGEPFLKSKLEKMYEEKFPKTQEEKILELQAEIDRLKNDSAKN